MENKETRLLSLIAYLKSSSGLFRAGWVKIKRPNTNGTWGPQGQLAIVWRSGQVESFMPINWIEACLKDDTCEVYPRVKDVPEAMTKRIYADNADSKEGKPFRDYVESRLINDVETSFLNQIPSVLPLISKEEVLLPKKIKKDKKNKKVS